MIRNWLRRVMIGRYGPDQLNIALLVLAIILSLVSSFTRWGILMILCYVVLILTILRMMSKNINARRKENDKFIKVWWPIRTKIKAKIEQLKSLKNYKYFKCPGCKKTLRVPRKKGKIQITCPKCGERFIRKT